QGEFAVAAGEADNFNKTWYKETISYFDVSDPNYWIIHKSLVQPQESPADYSSSQTPLAGTAKINEGAGRKDSDQTVEKSFKTITISGAVDVANYHQIFTSFIQPLIENKVEINIKITGKSTSVKPLSESSTAYKIAKESAKQLGLGFEEE
ncbi:hypothetical protein JXA02_10905, partial [candidate division KSB1 bacterium]|nr:hypothetical protein [candidate division KSB1 bacterium]